MRRGAALIPVIAAVALLAGCGGASSSSSTTTATTTTTQGTTTTEATTTTTTTAGETPTASLGVAKLQRLMTGLGYYTGAIDGVYGTETTAAVTAMQSDLGVTADGIFGAETYVALKANAKSRVKVKSVIVTIQKTLTRYGYYTGPIDGVYGEATTAGVKELQKDIGVTADGRVGPETVKAFYTAVANGDIKPTTG